MPSFCLPSSQLLSGPQSFSFSNDRSLALPRTLRLLARCSTETRNANHVVTDQKTIRDICNNMLPESFLRRAEELGYVYPTDVQAEALPVLLSGRDCLLHSQTGSGKTLCYLFAIFSKIDSKRAAVQAIVVVPTRELGMQVVKEARKFGRILEMDKLNSSDNIGNFNVMALLDGGSLNRQKIWLKADPPEIIVGTITCICKMIEINKLKVNAINTLVIDEVDAMFEQVQNTGLLRKLLTSYTAAQNRQTIFASATIPQYNQFIQKCITEKWVKENVIHVQVHHSNKMPENLVHHHVICKRDQKLNALNITLCADKPTAAIIFVNEQSRASKREGKVPSTLSILDALVSHGLNGQNLRPVVLEENSNINARKSVLDRFPNENNILIATDLTSRGLDIPEISHVYNFDLPPTATVYIHRGGRTSRKPLGSNYGSVTTFLTEEELFVFQRYQNEIMFQSTQSNVQKLIPN